MVLGLIETVEAVMSHISSNLQPREAHVTIVGSSSMAGSLAAWARAVWWEEPGWGCGQCRLDVELCCAPALCHVLTDVHKLRTLSVDLNLCIACWTVTFWRKTELGRGG